MKTHTLHVAVALGFLICGGRAGIAQQLSLSPPIIINLAEIDPYGVFVVVCAKTMDGVWLGLPYQEKKSSDVDTINSTMFHSVWIMDGAKVIAVGNLIGECLVATEPNSETKYGLEVGFASSEEAVKVRAKLKPNLDEMICRGKSRLNDKTLWVP
jgi:hypothetical protein